jgi:hypothetical protein
MNSFLKFLFQRNDISYTTFNHFSGIPETLWRFTPCSYYIYPRKIWAQSCSMFLYPNVFQGCMKALGNTNCILSLHRRGWWNFYDAVIYIKCRSIGVREMKFHYTGKLSTYKLQSAIMKVTTVLTTKKVLKQICWILFIAVLPLVLECLMNQTIHKQHC